MGKRHVKSKSIRRLLEAEQLSLKAKRRLVKAKHMIRKAKQMIRKARQKAKQEVVVIEEIKYSPSLTPVILKIIFFHNTKRSSFCVSFKRWSIFSVICKDWLIWMKIRNPILIYQSPLDILYEKAKKHMAIRTYNKFMCQLGNVLFITALYKKQTIQARDQKLKKEKKQFNVKYGNELGFRLALRTNKLK